jgi:hypothetical protein
LARHKLKSNGTLVKKLAVSAVAFTLLSVGSVATVAGFTNTATSTVTAKAGTVSLTAKNGGTTAITFGTTLKPDGIAAPLQTITVQNVGSLPLNFDIQSATTPAAGKLAEILDVTVTVGGNAPLPAAKLKSINTPSYSLAAGASINVTFSAKWTSTAADDTYQGADGATTLNFNATQQ